MIYFLYQIAARVNFFIYLLDEAPDIFLFPRSPTFFEKHFQTSKKNPQSSHIFLLARHFFGKVVHLEIQNFEKLYEKSLTPAFLKKYSQKIKPNKASIILTWKLGKNLIFNQNEIFQKERNFAKIMKIFKNNKICRK